MTTTAHAPSTTEIYLHAVRDVVVARSVARGTITPEQAEQLSHIKLMYGVGNGTYRGITVFGAWQNGVGRVDVVEVAATGQESWVQLAGTVIHELAHVLGGAEAGHGIGWKDLAVALGFVKRPAAAGQVYHLSLIEQATRHAVHSLAQTIGDGTPEFHTFGVMPTLPTRPRPCSAGIGTRGGTSRGKGSGSRMRLWQCQCLPPVKVRAASDDLMATCQRCGEPFHKA